MNPNVRHSAVLLFDVQDGNPNGDPDLDNMPRFDPETNQGLVSDVCMKRKHRNYVQQVGGKGNNIFVQHGTSLELQQKLPYISLEELKDKAKGKETEITDTEKARRWMCANFYDIRCFGAVMETTDYRCRNVVGPAQITFGRSYDPILSVEHGLTRVCQTTEKKQQAEHDNGTMGKKHTVAYGLYKSYIFYNAFLSAKTGFSEQDLDLFFKAWVNMFELDRSAARGLMSTRKLFVFEHSSALGSARDHKLFDLIKVTKKTDIPRSFTDYKSRSRGIRFRLG